MRATPRLVLTLALALALPATLPMLGPSATMQQAVQSKRPIELQDIINWKAIGTTAVSNDGQWFAYRIAPGEGDAQIVVRRTRSGEKDLTFEVGEIPTAGAAGGGGRGGDGGGAGSASLDFSEDSKFVAFTTYPSRREAQRLRRLRRPVQSPIVSNVTIVNLATGEKREYPRIRRFAFSGEASTWIALQRQPAQTTGGAAEGRGGAGGPAPAQGGAAGAANDRPRGTDLILRELASGQELNVGNVADFAFSKDGNLLAWTIDAQDKVGNGVQLRDMTRGTVAVLDNGNASYERLVWTEKGDGLTVLKGTEDRALRDKRYAVLGFSGFSAGAPQKTSFDPATDKTFPEGMTISPNRNAQWTEDLQALTFGIHTPRKRDAAADASEGDAPREGDDAARPATADGANPNADEKVDLVLWHWLDKRLQSQQEVQEAGDRSFSYLAEYRVQPKTFIRLADEDLRTVTVAPKERFAIGQDAREYELLGNLDGRRFQDIYVIDMSTGTRRLALKRARWYNGPSPDGKSFLYYEDGNYHVYSMESGQTRNITIAAPISFVDAEDDHNVVKPPAGSIGWTKDSASVLLSDNWDIWQVPVNGGTVVNLTANGRKDQIRYQRRYPIEPVQERALGIDLTRPQYFAAYGEWTKKAGIARLSPGKAGVEMQNWSDASFGTLIKVKSAEQFIYTRSTATEPTDYYITDASFAKGDRLTDQRPQVAVLRLDGRLDTRQLHERQGRQAAGRALPARRLREGQVVSDDREHLREDVAGREPVLQSRRERLQPLRLHKQRLRRAAARHHLQGERSRHVSRVVRRPGLEGRDCDRRDRPEEGRADGPLVGRVSDVVSRDPDRHVRGGRRRSAVDQHDQHVQPDLQEHRRRERRDLRGEPGAVQGRLLGQLGRLLPQLAGLLRQEREDAAHDPAQRQGRRRGLHPGRRVLQHAAPAAEAGHHARVRRREPRPPQAVEHARLHGPDEGGTSTTT